jgi:hypothetical protein
VGFGCTSFLAATPIFKEIRMKLLLGALMTLSAFAATAATPSRTYTNGDATYFVTTAENGDVTISATPEPCGPGERYPCPGNANPPRKHGHQNPPQERCGPGELYPCSNVPTHPRKGGSLPPRKEPCGAGELYPCTAPTTSAITEQVDTWMNAEGFVQQ